MNLSDDAEAVIHRQVDAARTAIDDVGVYFELAETAQKLEDGGYKRVALQFPDELLPHANAVVAGLRARCASELFVLGDTSYGSCCVDEVAAEHVDADCIVHYGAACLSPTLRLPVIYVFGRRDLDLDVLRGKTAHLGKVRLICDVVYTHLRDDIAALYDLDDTPDAVLLYIGTPSTTTLMTHSSQCRAMYSYDPDAATLREENRNAQLRRRYGQVLKVRDAAVVGIVVGTLGVARYLDLIATLKQVIAKAGRKSYTLAMGKPNPAKLANFAEIDAFVLVACPQTSLVEQRDFYKPVVTPFELRLALEARTGDAVSWTGEWVTDFDRVLSLQQSENERRDEADEDEDEDAPHFSLVTGKYHTARPTATALETGRDDDFALATRSSETALSKHAFASPALDHLKSRRWHGLGTDDQADELEGDENKSQGAVLREGRRGIAREYK